MRRISICALTALFCAVSTGATAGAFTDDMSKCVVAKSTTDDRTTLMVWMFSAIASHPAVQPMANVSDSERARLTKKVGEFVVRLLTVDCREQTLAALKYEGASAFRDAFELFGQVAMQGLIKDPAVAQHFDALKGAFDDPKMQSLFKEAGLPATHTK